MLWFSQFPCNSYNAMLWIIDKETKVWFACYIITWLQQTTLSTVYTAHCSVQPSTCGGSSQGTAKNCPEKYKIWASNCLEIHYFSTRTPQSNSFLLHHIINNFYQGWSPKIISSSFTNIILKLNVAPSFLVFCNRYFFLKLKTLIIIKTLDEEYWITDGQNVSPTCIWTKPQTEYNQGSQ